MGLGHSFEDIKYSLCRGATASWLDLCCIPSPFDAEQSANCVETAFALNQFECTGMPPLKCGKEEVESDDSETSSANDQRQRCCYGRYQIHRPAGYLATFRGTGERVQQRITVRGGAWLRRFVHSRVAVNREQRYAGNSRP